MKAIDQTERLRRANCLRRWYMTRGASRERGIYRRRITRHLQISDDRFYRLLEGRTYISDERAKKINSAANAYMLWQIDIFEL